MATVLATTSTSPTLAQVKSEAGILAEILARNTYPAMSVSPGMITLLKAINASADTTDLRTT